MKISRKTKYALKALQILAREQGKGLVLASTLASSEGMPHKFLELILLQLTQKGILQSRRGKGGGYRLRRPPEQVMVGEVVRLFDGPLAPVPCASESAFAPCEDCPDPELCGTRLVMREVRDAVARILDRTSIAAMNDRVEALLNSKNSAVMFHI